MREVLGPDKLVVVGLSVIMDTSDRETTRVTARGIAEGLLSRPSYAAAIAGLGYGERETAALSDELVDALVAHGDPDSIAAAIAAHLAAAADHVILMPPGAGEHDLMTGLTQLEHLATAVLHVR